MPAQVWRDNQTGVLYHDGCFEESETREGFTAVKLEELQDDDDCESCGGVFLIGLSPADDDADDDNGDDDTEES
jgi:hypothetical protein